MALLELECVSKRYGAGARVALDGVSLVVEPGEMVAVWGERRSGRSTLLRVAAGIELADSGVVRFEGRDLASKGAARLGGAMGYCRKTFRVSAGATVIEQLTTGQMARRVPRETAILRGWQALERVGVKRCGKMRTGELSVGEIARVSIARGLCSEPRLLVIDEPTIGVELGERDGILEVLRSLADDGVTVLSSTGEGTGVLGADRVLSLSKGRLRGDLKPVLAEVTDLGTRRHTG